MRNRSTNILINFQGRHGAGAACALSWAKGFKKIGCNVYAAISNEVDDVEEWTSLLGNDHIAWINLYKDKDHFDFALSTLKFLFIDSFKIRKQFSNIKFDIVLKTLYCHWSFIVNKRVKSEHRVTLVHDPELHSGEKRYIAYLYKKYVQDATDVFVLTKSFKPIVQKNYGISPDHIFYVPHGRMNMYMDKYDGSKPYTPRNCQFHIVFFGAIKEYKGLHVLAKACFLLSQKRKDFEVVVAGSGNFKPYMEEFDLLPNATIINRFISDEEVGGLFNVPGTICVIPYIDATQSGVIPIAYEYGTPIVASNTGGLKEQLDNGNIGLLFENRNPQELADKLECLMSNSGEYVRQQRIMKQYKISLDWDKVAALFLHELYGKD